MIRSRVTVTIDGRSFKRGVDGVVSDFSSNLNEAMRPAQEEVRAGLLNELADYPPERGTGRKFVWSNDRENHRRAARWWFAHIDDGGQRDGPIKTDGEHYIRTGNLANSWEVRIEDNLKERSSGIIVLNNAPDRKNRFLYRWVVGTFAQKDGKRWQIPGHERWYFVQDVTEKWFKVYIDKLGKFVKESNIRNR